VAEERKPVPDQDDRNRRADPEPRIDARPSEHEESAASQPTAESEPTPEDVVDEWGYESFPASDPPQH
jgi:hypothetical protein